MNWVLKKVKPFRKEFKTKNRRISVERRDTPMGTFGGGWYFEYGLSIKTGSQGLKGTILITWLAFTIRIDKKR